MSSPLILSFGGYSLSVTQFQEATEPRATISWLGISQSARGTSIRTGPIYRPKHIWTFTPLLSNAQVATLRRMFALYINSPGPWTIDDLISPLEEVSPRTRALATGGTEEDDSTTTIYHAKFYAEPTQYPSFEKAGDFRRFPALQFTETEVFAA